MNRPNVLLIYSDQMRADALGCAGHPLVQTSNMDRLAAEGVRFTNAYTSFPLCCPFRASLMTGKYAHSAGMYANHYPIPLDQDFLAQVLADNGYHTGYVGKWHLNGGPKHAIVPKEERLGFETFIGFSRGHRYFDSIFYRNDDPRPRVSKRYEPDYQTDHLIGFMQDCLEAEEQNPFFGMICYGLPHPPLHMPDHYFDMYDPADVTVADNTPEDKRETSREFLTRYYGMVTCVDDNIGRLMDWLDEQGIAKNTLVLVVSDHGELAGEHGRRGKKVCFRNSMQVPLIIRYPDRFEAGRTVGHLADAAVDTMPMLLDLAGIPQPKEIQGVSYLPLLDGSDMPVREAIHYEILKEARGPESTPIAERGIRTEEWLYVRTEDGPLFLFDLEKDPLEMNNLTDDPAQRERIADLDQQIAEHMQDTNDAWDIQAVFPPPNFETHEDGAARAGELVKEAIVEE